MSPSVRRIWLALLTIVMAIIVLRSLVHNNQQSQNQDEKPANSSTIETINLPARTRPAAHRAVRTGAPAHPRESRTSGVIELPLTPANITPPVSGYIVDQFRHWQAIPPGYIADNILVKDGAITLPGAADTSSPRDGMLVSPPLPLSLPAMAGPVDQSITLPEGAGLQLQISLSDDGETWSPWQMVQRYGPPDGKRIAPAMQPMLANADLALLDSQSSSSHAAQNMAGPRIRYRLGLSATAAAPAVSDLRIWKRFGSNVH